MPATRIKVLFFAEGATLAHVGRPFVLATGLDPKRFEVVFARPRDYEWLTANAALTVVDLACQAGAMFSNRLRSGFPLYDFPTLQHYVEDDLALIDAQQPNVIVGDFRLSLSVSARLSGVPYITICDAYWSPERPMEAPLPVLGFTRFVPIPLAQRIFQAVSPLALHLHAKPMERLRARFGLTSLDHDLRRCYTDADLRLFANFPALFPELRLTPRADFLGPIAWSPPDRTDLDFLEGKDPLVYVTMGSSGNPHALRILLPILEGLNVRIVVASAGKELPSAIISERIRCFDYLPGHQVCQHAALVVCNGGSPTTNQALSHGVPVLGIMENMDQFLNMQAITRFGAGLSIRADRLVKSTLQDSVKALLRDDRYTERAHSLARSIENLSPNSNFERHLHHIMGSLEEARTTKPTNI